MKENSLYTTLKKLEIIRNYILIQEHYAIPRLLFEIENEKSLHQELIHIVSVLKSEEYSNSLLLINEFLNSQKTIEKWIDPEILNLKAELGVLFKRFENILSKKFEVQKILNEFDHRYTIEFGELIIQILKLKKKLYINDKKNYEKTEQQERKYNNQLEKEKGKYMITLNPEESKELKVKFRKACHLCHPDKVDKKFKAKAEKIFTELKDAYELNDLERVSEILRGLEKGNIFTVIMEDSSDKQRLKDLIDDIKEKIKIEDESVSIIKRSDVYQMILSISDWKSYFNKIRKEFELQKETLEVEIEKVNYT